jgi:hypothetical protein
MLKRQEMGEQMFPPAQVESSIGVLAAAHPDRSASTWDLLRSVLKEGAQSLDQRLEQSGRLEPERFSLRDANERLAKLLQLRRFQSQSASTVATCGRRTKKASSK